MELVALCLLAACAVTAAPSGRIAFPDDSARSVRKLDEPLLPPVLPVLPHLENDPSTRLASDDVAPRNSRPAVAKKQEDLKPRLGFSHGFDVSPNSAGGLTATYSNGFSGLGSSQSAAHSFSVGFDNGFQATQAASSSNSFNNPGHSGTTFSSSQASSQASSFSGGINGISASSAAASAAASAGNGQASANSQSAGFGTTFGGNAASGSQSSSSAFGSGNSLSNAAGFAISNENNYSGNRPGNNHAGNRPGNNYFGQRPVNSYSGSSGSSGSTFGEGSIDIRNKPNRYRGVATSIVFPGESSRSRIDIGDGDEVITLDADRWLGGSTSYKSKNDGGLADLLSILISD